jgi:excinuclease ABC subunit C
MIEYVKKYLKRYEINNMSNIIKLGWKKEKNNEIKIDKKSNVFRLLSRIDEEVHRFTINYHKEIRSKGSISSVLDNINGLGEVRKKTLIKKYGSVSKIKEASVEELSEIIPLKVAEDLNKYLSDL